MDGRFYAENDKYLMDIVKKLKPKIWSDRAFKNTFDKNVNPLSLVEIKNESNSRWLLFALCMFFLKKN